MAKRKRTKGQATILYVQSIHIKLKIKSHEPH